MLELLNEELVKAKREKQKWQDLHAELKNAEEMFRQEKEFQSELQIRFDREKTQVENLSGFHFAAWVSRLWGTRDERIKKGKQKCSEIESQYLEQGKLVRNLEKRIEDLRRQLETMGDAPARYESVLSRKEKWLLNSNDERHKEFANLCAWITEIHNQIQKLDHVLGIGKETQVEFGKAILSMHKASTWGKVDILGGGWVSTAIKHSNIDLSQIHCRRIQILLKQFQGEIAEMMAEPNMEKIHLLPIEMDSFLKFADHFLDNWIIDLKVQKRITRCNDGLTKSSDQLRLVLSEIEKIRQELNSKMNRLTVQRLNWLENC